MKYDAQMEQRWTPKAILDWEVTNVEATESNRADMEEALEIILVLQARVRRERAVGNIMAENAMMLGLEIKKATPSLHVVKRWIEDVIHASKRHLASDLRPIPDYGYKFTLEEFREAVERGMFIDWDGSGYYATETEMSELRARPSAIRVGEIERDFTHVVWFNK
jgi:hypothetical protein